MATSKYLRHSVGTEQRLYESLITESIQHYGENVYYLPRTVNGLDRILNEDAESQFNDAWLLEMYPESIEGFEGQGDLMQKFGLEIRDEVTLVVAKRVWERWVGVNTRRDNVRPMAGDLIYLPWSKTYFEVTFVEHEKPFYQLMDRPTYKLSCSLFELSSEKFYTGIPQIDKIYKDNAPRKRFRIADVEGIFEIGERIHQVVQVDPFYGIDGELAEWDRSTNEIALIDIATSDYSNDFGHHEFKVGPVNGTKTGSIANIIEVFDLHSSVDHTEDQEDEAGRNWEYGLFADDILDFTENNPFGEGGERDIKNTGFDFGIGSKL